MAAGGRRSLGGGRRSKTQEEPAVQITTTAPTEQEEGEDIVAVEQEEEGGGEEKVVVKEESGKSSTPSEKSNLSPLTEEEESDLSDGREEIDEERVKKEAKQLGSDLIKTRKQAVEDRLVLVNKEIAALENGRGSNFILCVVDTHQGLQAEIEKQREKRDRKLLVAQERKAMQVEAVARAWEMRVEEASAEKRVIHTHTHTKW